MLPVVYINLDGDLERRQAIEAMLRRIGVEPIRLPAVIWGNLSPAEQSSLYDASLNLRQFERPLAAGELGCYASHLRACEWLLASTATALVVLEDDVLVDDAFSEVVQAIEALPADAWDLIKLHSRPNERPWDRLPLAARYDLIAYRRVPSMSNGYVVSRAGAAKLLMHRRPFGRPVDIDVRYWWEAGLRVLGVWPTLVHDSSAAQVSSIWRVQRLRRSAAQRWRRLQQQVGYTLRNAWYRWRLNPLSALKRQLAEAPVGLRRPL